MLENRKYNNYQFDTYNGIHVASLIGHSKDVTKICIFNPWVNRIISTSADQTIRVWKLQNEGDKITAFNIFTLIGHDDQISCCSLSKNNELLATSSFDNTVKVWDMNKGMCYRTLFGHTDKVLCVNFDEEERRIISGSSDISIRLWDVFSDEQLNNTLTHKGPITSISVIRDRPRSTFISASGTGELIEWDILKLTSSMQYEGHVGGINSISVSMDSIKIVAGGDNDEVTVWNSEFYHRHESFISKGITRSVSISPVHLICAVASEDKIMMFHFSVFSPYQIITPQDIDHKNPPKVTALNWSDNSHFLYAGYSDGKIRVFQLQKVPTPRHLQQLFSMWGPL